jgi:hypothetical protein
VATSGVCRRIRASIVATVNAHILTLVIVMAAGFAGSRALVRFLFFAWLPLEGVVLFAATYWKTSPRLRIIERNVAVLAWVAFGILRVTHAWMFASQLPDMNDVERFQMAGTVFLIATAPVLAALLVVCSKASARTEAHALRRW